MKKVLLSAVVVAVAAATGAAQQQGRPASPLGSAQTQVGGEYVKDAQGRERYQDGKWIEITYSRPIKRGRDLFGSGADYGKTLNAGAPVWRAGANQTTRLKTEVPLVIAGKTIPAGEYSLFVELKSPTEWNLIVSSWAAQEKYDPNNKDALWGSYNYTPDKDLVRAPMTLGKLNMSLDQLTWAFADVTKDSGKIALAWDTVLATVPFTVGK
ncbi:MAG TPA: DUF2911 domain-containing protein [Vicinamibacterales bacterium]|nr:DUF2911 domain-containing protein [Vicinamibacterales bacterium]